MAGSVGVDPSKIVHTGKKSFHVRHKCNLVTKASEKINTY